MLGRVLDLLFPARCAGCGRGPSPFCSSCLDALVPIEPPWCGRCGRPTDRPSADCPDCPPGVATCRAPFLFEGPARSAVHGLKFSGLRSIARGLAAAMVAVNEFEADAVTWVPLSRSRLVERGFDQARALAGPVGSALGIPVRSLLLRAGSSVPQARRGGRERRSAMEGLFTTAVRSPPPRVLIVDDVLTTGATVAACAEALLAAGAGRVGVLTAARAATGRLRVRI